MRSSRFGKLHVKLPRYAEAHHDYRFAGENIHQALRVHARGQHLDQGRGAAVDGIGQRKNVAGGNGDVFREAAIGVASE